MLGKKRGKKPLIHKKTSEKLTSLNDEIKNSNKKKLETKKKIPKKKEEESEESINSELASLDESSSNPDKEEENNDKKNLNMNTNVIESYDEKKLRMAKMLLDKFDKENKDEDEKSNSEEENSEDIMNKKIIEKYTKEMKNQKINFFSEDKNKNIIFSPQEISFIKGHKSTITDISISSKGDFILSSSKDTRGILFDLNKESKILFPKFTTKALTCCILSPDEKTAFFGGKDHYIYQIDIKSFDIIQKIKAHTESVTGIIFDKIKDQFYSVGNDKVLKVWSTDTNPAILLETFYGHTNKINCIKNMPGEINRYITTSLDGYINLWKVDSQSFLQFNANGLYPIDCISPLSNEIFFTGNFNGTIQAWKTNKKKSVYKMDFAHGFQENFNINHPFFDLNMKNKGPKVEVGNPILSLECPVFSDLLISGSVNGEINFYEVNENDTNNISLEIKTKLNIKNKGCLNVIKYCPEKKFIVIGNGTDNKFGRWNKEYDTKLGISIVKLVE